jgi:hypothetical protein
VDSESKNLLQRWKSLETGDALQRASSRVRFLWFAGLGLCIFVVFGLAFGLHPIAIAVAAAVMGWIVAESNALRTRLAQWPLFRRYIDWKRVEEDLGSSDTKV